MPLGAAFAAMVVGGIVVAVAALLVLRTSGASPSLARRLAGPASTGSASCSTPTHSRPGRCG